MADDVSLIVFRIGDRRFATPIGQIRKVKARSSITDVPNQRGALIGILMQRNQVVPIIDLARRFHFEVANVQAKIMILEIRGEMVGVSVQEVEGVRQIKPDAIEKIPSMIREISGKFIQGVMKIDDDTVIIIDFLKVFAPEEIKLMATENVKS